MGKTKSRKNVAKDSEHEGREQYFIDIDRMVNEGLGGGEVTEDNGLIEDTTTDTMSYPESVLDPLERKKTNSKKK